ncbi:MAG TPA: SRPBCC family protein [Chloroflexota bacterium]|nr:SRPBCC family protein [Chloroflexota bacterium]
METKATPDRVWSIWSDTSTWPQWNPDVKAVSLDGPFQDGTKGTMTTTRGTHKITLQNIENGKSFDIMTWPLPATRFRFHCEVEPSPEGSRISQGVAMFGWLGPMMSILTGRSTANGFVPVLAGLAKAAESSPAG